MIEKFEDLLAWQEARKLVKVISLIIKKQGINKDLILIDQITRSSRSVMANIAEGFGRYTYRDNRQFIIIARGSLAETQNHLYITLDLDYITREEFDNIYELTVNIYKLLNGLANHLKKAQDNINNKAIANN